MSHRSPLRTGSVLSAIILSLAAVAGCRADEIPSTGGYAPYPADGWEISAPSEMGLDPRLVDRLFSDASELETVYGLVVVMDGSIVAERYFNGAGPDQLSSRQSITKSVTSALTGIALEDGRIAGTDRTMLEFFPEYDPMIRDPRKRRITVEHLLTMRSGYRNEQIDADYFHRLFGRNDWHWTDHAVDFMLTADPGEEFQYSEIGYHLLGAVVARACGADLETLARERLFDPIGARLGSWSKDSDGYNFGNFEIYLTARDMARFGLLYLDGGTAGGRRILGEEWVRRSRESITEHAWHTRRIGRYLRNVGYGYGWWSADAGRHRVSFAWGHGGQLIVLVPELRMVIVATADPLKDKPAGLGWKDEKAVIDTVGRFVRTLPEEIES